MMTIDEAIVYYEEQAKKFENVEKYKIVHVETGAGRYVEEHRQLAEWLRELQDARETLNTIHDMVDYSCDDILNGQSVTAKLPTIERVVK